jgi:hypothetical protein
MPACCLHRVLTGLLVVLGEEYIWDVAAELVELATALDLRERLVLETQQVAQVAVEEQLLEKEETGAQLLTGLVIEEQQTPTTKALRRDMIEKYAYWLNFFRKRVTVMKGGRLKKVGFSQK